MTRTARFKFVGWWLLIGAIAAGVCALRWPSAHLGDEYLPFTNDSFYHARRILDTVADPSAFYEVDMKIHAPEGSLLPWPWGYDYAMAWLVKAGSAIGLADSPLAILIWLPVVAVFVSIGLMLLVARRLGLTDGLVLVAGLAAALSPLTQYLHGVGQIDHHFAEYIFVLATIACGLKWLSRPVDARAAIVLGIVLGAAPAIHNALFILQLPVLASLLVLWSQDVRTPLRAALSFAGALLLTTLVILLPSLPFRLGMFEFYTLSWFHLYVAAGSAATVLALSGLARSGRNVALLAGMGLLLILPLVRQIALAGAFLGGTVTRLETIVEMHSIPPMVLTSQGRMTLSQVYSLLIWLTPAAAVYCAWRGWRERAMARVLFWICCLFGLALMLTQLRMHYFGSFILYLPWLLLAQALMERWPERGKLVMLSVSLLFLLAYWPAGRYQLAQPMPLAGDANFRALRPILEDLRKACAQDPGIVLADNDAGHFIRYYTDCSVIANNFLLTRQHEQKIKQIDYLTSVPANAFPGVAPYVRYILIRPIMIHRGASQTKYMSYSQQAAPLISDLLLRPVEAVPSNYVLIEQANIRESGASGIVPYIRLYKMNPVAPVPGPALTASEAAAHGAPPPRR